MVFKEEKWTVCYYEDHQKTFDQFDNKEEVYEFIDDRMEEHGTMLNDFLVYPPNVNLTKEEMKVYGIPKRFL